MNMHPPLMCGNNTYVCSFDITALENISHGLIQLTKNYPKHKVCNIEEYAAGNGYIIYIVVMRPKTIFDRIKQHIQSLLNKR